MNPIDFILHVDQHLIELVQNYGIWIYAILFLIVFVETGVVVMPLLPGDSLLFAAGMLAAVGKMDPVILTALLWTAAVLGDNCNYWVGRKLGRRVFDWDSRWLKKKHLIKSEQFFLQYGVQAIIVARFMPFARTFTPFIAGVSAMPYGRFVCFDMLGGALWVGSFVWAGYFLGNIPFVKENFAMIGLAIIAISISPVLIAWLRQKMRKDVANL